MFFEITRQSDNSFTHSTKLTNELWLNCDAGWQRLTTPDATVHIKGYVEDRPIDQQFIETIIANPVPHHQGNFLAIICHNNGIINITHDIHRASPLAMSSQPFIVTNLLNNNLEQVWADRTISIDDELNITEHFFNPYGLITINTGDRTSVINKLHQTLNTKFENFFRHNTQPIKIFLSGGIDTLTLFSYVKKFTDNYELCNYEHIDFTKFYCNKKHIIDQYWGYKQIHLWKDPSILLTGANGDENLLRSPATITLLLMHYGLELADIIKSHHYHYLYLTADKLKLLYDTQRKNIELIDISKDYVRLTNQILNINLHDHQHWHFDNTLTYTPFKDLELCKLMLSLPKDDLLDQILDAGISKELIRLNDPTLLDALSIQKNYNTQENLYKIYNKFC